MFVTKYVEFFGINFIMLCWCTKAESVGCTFTTQ